MRFKYFQVVNSMHFWDQCIQFIVPTKRTLWNTYAY